MDATGAGCAHERVCRGDTGQGGWPLTVFVTPDGYPLYAVLYLPPERFLQVIRRIHELWVTDRNQLAALARRAAVVAEGPGRPQIDAQRVRGRG